MLRHLIGATVMTPLIWWLMRELRAPIAVLTASGHEVFAYVLQCGFGVAAIALWISGTVLMARTLARITPRASD